MNHHLSLKCSLLLLLSTVTIVNMSSSNFSLFYDDQFGGQLREDDQEGSDESVLSDTSTTEERNNTEMNSTVEAQDIEDDELQTSKKGKTTDINHMHRPDNHRPLLHFCCCSCICNAPFYPVVSESDCMHCSDCVVHCSDCCVDFSDSSLGQTSTAEYVPLCNLCGNCPAIYCTTCGRWEPFFCGGVILACYTVVSGDPRWLTAVCNLTVTANK